MQGRIPRIWHTLMMGRTWPAVIALLGAMALLPGCATLRSDYVKRASSALPPQFDTATARYVLAELDQHPGKSGFRLLQSSTDALMSRVWLIDHAHHSIDLQYFVFENDATGRLVAQHLLAAADRGVRVRLLLDDISLKDEDRLLGALAAHPQIEVRLFNPFRTRDPSPPSKIIQLALEGRRLNRRMHNKSFIVDGLVAVVGGRNIGDPYFDAGSDNNFRDLDLITIGPVVGEAAHAFDAYWNSDVAYPLNAYRTTRNSRADLSQLRPALRGEVRGVRAVGLRAGGARGAAQRRHRRPVRAGGCGGTGCCSPISRRRSRPMVTIRRCASGRSSGRSSGARKASCCWCLLTSCRASTERASSPASRIAVSPSRCSPIRWPRPMSRRRKPVTPTTAARS